MNDIPLGILFAILGGLIFLSACFSGSETALMTLNRYRMRHQARAGHRGARAANVLLQQPDRLLSLILLGNNFVNILASSIATVIALRLWGEAGFAIATGALTFVVLIFAEVTPKTLAALHPERIAYPAAFVYIPLLKLCYPLVWVINKIASGLLRVLGVSASDVRDESLNSDELRSVVLESGSLIPKRHQRLLLNVFDLENVTVDDIMIPRTKVAGINLEDDRDEILRQLIASPYTLMPVFEGQIDNILGILPMRKALLVQRHHDLDADKIRTLLQPAYFVPENTPLNHQLLKFQRAKERLGLIVDEYGDLQGLVTLVDIIEEIVGEFTPEDDYGSRQLHPQNDGSYLVNGSMSLRDLNRATGWCLPTDGPKTFSGLITEYLEDIPQTNTSLMLSGHPVEILQIKRNKVKVARIQPTSEPADNSTVN